MKTLMSILTLVAVPAIARAQSEVRPEPDTLSPWGKKPALAESHEEIGPSFDLSVLIHASLPGGGHISSDADIVYSDIFNTGFGFSVEGDLVWPVLPETEVGGYVSVGWDRFSGGSTTVFDPAGNAVELDPSAMTLTTAVLGAKMQGRFFPFFFWDTRIGVGWAHYQAVEATFKFNGAPSSNLELFASSDRALFDLGARFGFGSPNVTFDVGFDWKIMGGPAAGSDAARFPFNVSTDAFDMFLLEIGVTFRFGS